MSLLVRELRSADKKTRMDAINCKGKLIWQKYAERNRECGRDWSGIQSRFVRHIWNENYYDAPISGEKLLAMIRLLKVNVDANAKKCLERRFQCRIVLNPDQTLDRYTTPKLVSESDDRLSLITLSEDEEEQSVESIACSSNSVQVAYREVPLNVDSSTGEPILSRRHRVEMAPRSAVLSSRSHQLTPDISTMSINQSSGVTNSHDERIARENDEPSYARLLGRRTKRTSPVRQSDTSNGEPLAQRPRICGGSRSLLGGLSEDEEVLVAMEIQESGLHSQRLYDGDDEDWYAPCLRSQASASLRPVSMAGNSVRRSSQTSALISVEDRIECGVSSSPCSTQPVQTSSSSHSSKGQVPIPPPNQLELMSDIHVWEQGSSVSKDSSSIVIVPPSLFVADDSQTTADVPPVGEVPSSSSIPPVDGQKKAESRIPRIRRPLVPCSKRVRSLSDSSNPTDSDPAVPACTGSLPFCATSVTSVGVHPRNSSTPHHSILRRSHVTSESSALHSGKTPVRPVWISVKPLEGAESKVWLTAGLRDASLIRLRREISILYPNDESCSASCNKIWREACEIIRDLEFDAAEKSEAESTYRNQVTASMMYMRRKFDHSTTLDKSETRVPLPISQVISGSKFPMRICQPRCQQEWHSTETSRLRSLLLRNCWIALRDTPQAVAHFLLPNLLNLEGEVYSSSTDRKRYEELMSDLTPVLQKINGQYKSDTLTLSPAVRSQ